MNDANNDAGRAANRFGRVEEERDADGLRVFTYDWRGQPTAVEHRFWDLNWQEWDNGTLASIEAQTGGDNTRWASTWRVMASDMLYDQRGKLMRSTNGNGTSTERTYDPDIERLLRVFTTRDNGGGGVTALQDLRYGYDPVGNPVRITDGLATSSYAHNGVIPNTRTFRYDPRYRLVGATGKKLRSIAAGSVNPVQPTPQPSDYEAYDYRYAYDEVGNLRLNHELARGPLHFKQGRVDLFNGTGPEALSDDPEQGNYTYDANGNCTRTPRQVALGYSFDGQPVWQKLVDEPSANNVVRYVRHGDQRVLRLLRKNGGTKALGVYLGPFELHCRTTGGAVTYTKASLQVSVPDARAQLEVVLDGVDTTSVEVFFTHTDHLGSGHILTDGAGELLSQEEYFPYGRSSDRRDERSRYRYIGVETDEETGLLMTGPRSYDPVTGRFLSGDPLASTEYAAFSPFQYSRGNPVLRSDGNGYGDEPPGEQTTPPSSGTPPRDTKEQATDPSHVGDTTGGATKRGEEVGVTLDSFRTGQPRSISARQAENFLAANERATQLLRERVDARLAANDSLGASIEANYREVGAPLEVASNGEILVALDLMVVLPNATIDTPGASSDSPRKRGTITGEQKESWYRTLENEGRQMAGDIHCHPLRDSSSMDSTADINDYRRTFAESDGQIVRGMGRPGSHMLKLRSNSENGGEYGVTMVINGTKVAFP